MTHPQQRPTGRQDEGPLHRFLSALGWLLYGVFNALVLALALPWLALRRGGHYRPTLLPRLGFGKLDGDPCHRGGLWIHAVSVGEVGVAATLVKALPPDLPLVVTTVTPTGQAQAKKAFQGRAAVAYLPFEWTWAVRRFLRHFEPRALILAEGDLWPRVLREVNRRGIPAAVVNGRVSDRNFRRLQRLPRILTSLYERLLLEPVDHFGAQTEADAGRWIELGVPEARVAVTGNLKYETPEPPSVTPELAAALKRLAAGRPLLLAGSTMAGEEGAVLEAFQRLGSERALLLLAPRHPERCPEVEAQIQAAGLSLRRRSALDTSSATEGDTIEVVLLDTLGELAGLYRLAAGAFIGGTLVPTGGHNPLEAARFAVPVVVGPSMDNFREIAGHFDAADAWRRVTDAAELAAVWRNWLDEPAAAEELGARGRGLIEKNRGAVERTVHLLKPLLKPLLEGIEA